MSRNFLLMLSLPSVTLLGCQRTPQVVQDSYPDMVVSISGTNIIEFGELEFGESVTRTVLIENLGELTLGIESIALDGSGMPQHFSVSYDPADISCSGDAGVAEDNTDTTDTGAAAKAKGVGVDTADTGEGEDSGGGPSGGDSGDTGGVGVETEDILQLPGSCRIPVDITFSPTETGTLLGAMEIITTTEKLQEGESTPSYYADPYNYKEVTIFRGEGLQGYGDIFVQPRQIDFGSLWVGETEHAYVFLDNVGDGDLTLGEPVLDKNCSKEFQIDLAEYDADRLLEPGVGTLYRVTYTPETTTGTQCAMYVYSDDRIEAEVEVTMIGNAGLDPDSTPPTVQIINPSPGYAHTAAGPISLEIQLNDLDQPPGSLTCTVKAAAQINGTLGSCSPDSESGYVVFEVDTDLLKDGPESLLVTVIDMDGLTGQASTSILWNSTGSDADDDGDGFGNSQEDIDAGIYDCDDDDINTYPGAAEVYDGIDNDCDLAVDEGTNGADDDGDSVSELDGDCNDDDPDTYPGAPEVPDFNDNDCDGLIDEGTATYDGDGDGYSLSSGDCNDADPDRSPAAIEYCGDGVDNDCDYQTDYADLDGCVEQDTRPIVVGGCIIGQRSLNLADSTTIEMYVYDPDTEDEDLTYEWTVSPPGLGTLTSAGSSLTAWGAPTQIAEADLTSADRKDFLVYGIVTDPDNGQAWCSDAINVYSEPIVDYRERITNVEELSGGCGDDSANAVFAAPLLGLLALGSRRRRRRDEA